MPSIIDKIYAPLDVEGRIYDKWISRGYFRAKADKSKTPYTIVIPPPNITGQLHIGHALDNTLQDILIRWRRMMGYGALWMPGTDHASIATEAKITEALESEGTTKGEIGRDAFMKRAWEWRELYGGRIIEQLKRLGCSCDWERERFTMDAGLSDAVAHVFVRLYEDGLIYKGERIINWCPGCRTSISDIEVDYHEHDGQFWYIRYPIAGGGGEFITVATTRPETMLGDTAVAVNPDDPRYSGFVGKKAVLPLMGREIPIVADSYVDGALGTGAVKITPAHDPNDFELGLRHNLDRIVVMDGGAVMNGNAGAYEGLSREDARAKVVADLRELGLIEKVEKHVHNVGECSRCQAIIETLASSQWFVKMKPLAEPAIEVVKEGVTRFIPDRFTKIYYNWMENIQDWCVSRQLWWGHRIPAYYCDGCGEVTVSAKTPAACGKCGGALRQDEDVLDTWFSSALWPFSTLGWPEKNEDLDYFYPTDVLVTGYDIIFFWVARMIFSGVKHTGKSPFKYVYIHGMVRDDQGRKMSKSSGNGIDPLEIVDQYGADALRFSLTSGNAPGNDLRLSEEKVKAARNFANKLWNATRFVLANLEAGGADNPAVVTGDAHPAVVTGDENLQATDRWVLSMLNECVRDVSENLEKFELGVALTRIYDFIWDIFCDWYIEIVKPRLSAGGDKDQPAALKADQGRAEALLTLRYVLVQSLKLLHPFMPFITEEIYDSITRSPRIGGASGLVAILAEAGGKESVMIDEWPVYKTEFVAERETATVSRVVEMIRAIRNLRSEMNVPPSKKLTCVFVADDDGLRAALEEGRGYVGRLSGLGSFEIRRRRGEASGPSAGVGDVAVVAGGAEAFIPLGELVDAAAERKRLEKELAAVNSEIERATKKLENPGFVNKAPQGVVDDERRKLKSYAEDKLKIEENLVRICNIE